MELLYFYIAFSYLVQVGVMSVDEFNLVTFLLSPITFPIMLGRYLAGTFKK